MEIEVTFLVQMFRKSHIVSSSMIVAMRAQITNLWIFLFPSQYIWISCDVLISNILGNFNILCSFKNTQFLESAESQVCPISYFSRFFQFDFWSLKSLRPS